MPIQFFEDSQDPPTIQAVYEQTAYCSPSDVASLNKARQIGVGNNPNLQDIDSYITMIAGQVDALLLTKGHQVPVNTASYPEAEGLLSWVNATGAAWMMEEASPNSMNVDRLKAAFDNAMRMLSEAKLIIETPMEEARAKPRAPYLTYQPPCDVYDPTFRSGRGPRERPYFSRDMQW